MRDEIQKAAAKLYCSSQSVCDSVKPSAHCDQATPDYQKKSNAHYTKLDIIELKHLPRSWNNRGVEAGNGHNQHSVLFCHRSAKLIMRAGDFSCGPNIRSEDCQNCCKITERDIAAPGQSCTDEHRSV